MLRDVRRWLTAVGVFLALAAPVAAWAGETGRVFYLAIHPRECLIGTANPRVKSVLVVPCSNRAHNFEVYAVGHGGWGHRAPPSTAFAVVKSVCVSAYQRLTGHALAAYSGWWGVWPDAGAETARYGDRIVCSFRTWPRLAALGTGWHVR